MSVKSDDEYQKVKAFLAFYSARYLGVDRIPPEERPMARLEALEQKSKRLARQGLSEAVNDILEMSRNLNSRAVAELDGQLHTQGLPTLTEMQRRYSKAYSRILKRGRINNETEYYLIRNVLDDRAEKTEQERLDLDRMIGAYEARIERQLDNPAKSHPPGA